MHFKNSLFWIAAFVVLVLDQTAKHWVTQNFQLEETRPLLPGIFHLTYVTNSGAAFSLFSQGGGWLRWLSLVVSFGLVLLAWLGPSLSRWEQLGYGLILGGAMGNGIDRFVSGRVVDFLDFRLIHFAVFNVADVFINVGIACLLIASFQPPTANRKSRR